MKKQKCPEIRFKGFNNEWEQICLKDFGYTFTGLSGKTKDDFGHGDGQFITYMNVFANTISDLKGVEKVEIDFNQSEVKYGDVLFTTSSETPHEVGMSSVWLGDKPNTYLNSFCFGFRPFNNQSPYFLAYLLRSKSIRKQLIFLAQGISRYNISKTKAMEIFLYQPCPDEQDKIGHYLKNIDQSIVLQQQKYTKTQSLKKAMLEKMFPKAGSKQPEIRLKGFGGDWEMQPLENIFGKIRNAFVGTATPYYVKSGRFYLESNNVKDGKINRKSQIFINDYFYYKQQDKWLKTNDIVMVQSGHVGHTAVIPEELNNSAAHALIMFTDYKVDTDPHFINYQIQTYKIKNEIDKITTGNTIKHILSSDMKKFSLIFPCNEEQTAIGQFFKQLDDTLALQQQQLQTLKNLKQAFLAKMFV